MELDQLKAKIAEDRDSLDKKIEAITAKQKKIEEENASYLEKIGVGSGKAPDVHTSKTRMGSYEQKLLGSFKAKNFKDLIQINVADPAYRMVDRLKEVADISRYIAQIYYDGARDGVGFADGKVAKVNTILESNYAKEHLVPLLKAFDSGTANLGGAWVPTIISSSYQEEYELEFELAAPATKKSTSLSSSLPLRLRSCRCLPTRSSFRFSRTLPLPGSLPKAQR
jgi:hypothetical protein